MSAKISPRKQEILNVLIKLLENNENQNISISLLAKNVGISEPAIYRHFKNKKAIFEHLIDFIKNSIISRIKIIIAEENSIETRCKHIVFLMLSFAEQNAGISKILNGSALQNEDPSLLKKVDLIFNELEQYLINVINDRPIYEKLIYDAKQPTSIFIAYIVGKIYKFIRSEFKEKPTKDFKKQWELLKKCL